MVLTVLILAVVAYFAKSRIDIPGTEEQIAATATS
jgi:hypothetical protein